LDLDILNSGIAKAGPFWVEVTVDFNPAPPQPLLPGQVPQTRFGPFRQRCQGLLVGGVQRFRPFPLGLQNPGDGYFVQACIAVDPPTDASPGGEIWESDETNNTDCCRVYTTFQEPETPPTGL
jgi:hypothetical protein